MQQAAVFDVGARVDAFLVKAREGGSRGDAVEAVAVIKQAKFHKLIVKCHSRSSEFNLEVVVKSHSRSSEFNL